LITDYFLLIAFRVFCNNHLPVIVYFRRIL
jgi:hypothetical protein